MVNTVGSLTEEQKSILNKDKIYFRIRIRTKSAMKFIQLIDKFVLPKFKYKYPSVMTP